MPLMIRCRELRPGMTLWEPLIDEGRTLITPGRPLPADAVAQMQTRCPEALVRVTDPRLDQAADFENDVEDRAVAQTVRHRLAPLLARAFDRFATGPHADFSENEITRVRHAIAEVVQYLRFHHVSSIAPVPCTNPATFLADHLANVVFTSLVLGGALRAYVSNERQRQAKAPLTSAHVTDLTPLALGAAFLDIGLLPLRHLFGREGALTAAERDAVRGHCEAGVDMMPESFSSLGRMIIRGHHEKMDGSGYPAGLDARKLHVFLRIAHIADTFNARTSRFIFPQAESVASIAWGMAHGPARWGFDPALVSIFVDMLRPFPIGARVELTDGRQGVVVRHRRGRPFQPRVLIAFDDWGRPLNPPIGPIDLDTEETLDIRAYDGEDVGYLYGQPPLDRASVPGQPSVDRASLPVDRASLPGRLSVERASPPGQQPVDRASLPVDRASPPGQQSLDRACQPDARVDGPRGESLLAVLHGDAQPAATLAE